MPDGPLRPPGPTRAAGWSRRFGLLEQGAILRGLYIGRTLLAAVVLVQAELVRDEIPGLAFTGMMVVLTSFLATGYGLFVLYARKTKPGLTFLQSQAAMDLLLVTALVHFDTSKQTGWAALYVLVIMAYALLMPLRASVITALFGATIFLADAYFGSPSEVGAWLWGQVGAFTIVFLVIASLGQRLQVASVEHSVLATELRRVRLEADEILRNIRSGVVTVDGTGGLAFINVAAEHLLGLPEIGRAHV